MFISILEARVTPERWEILEEAYHKALKNIPPELRQSFLIQETQDRYVWRIITLWKSYEAYQAAQEAATTHTCVEVFRAANVEPTRRTFNVVEEHMRV